VKRIALRYRISYYIRAIHILFNHYLITKQNLK
jgi:hypothetical protein